MVKPYIKKYCDISKFSIWIVDGKYIRENIDEEFTNFGHHYRFDFIPDNEFWIDKEADEGEQQFYIDHMLIENRLMKKGINYGDAIEIADKKEQKERAKSKFLKQTIKNKKDNQEAINKIHQKLWEKYSGEIKIWIVNGELVRDLFYIDFTEGGHDLVYPFIPKKEVWIDNDVSVKEREFILLHELHERNLMAMGWCYDTNKYSINTGKIKKSAHQSSSEIEFFCRHHPDKLEDCLKKEIKNQE